MNIAELIALKERMGREAEKWCAYLQSVPTEEARAKELTRKLTETWLEGRASRDAPL